VAAWQLFSCTVNVNDVSRRSASPVLMHVQNQRGLVSLKSELACINFDRLAANDRRSMAAKRQPLLDWPVSSTQQMQAAVGGTSIMMMIFLCGISISLIQPRRQRSLIWAFNIGKYCQCLACSLLFSSAYLSTIRYKVDCFARDAKLDPDASHDTTILLVHHYIVHTARRHV
jgi:hypothetical protein